MLRLYESGDKAGEVELSGIQAGIRIWETTVTEDELSECPVLDGKLRLAFRPWQVRTVLLSVPASGK